jgi:serine protease DegQ
MDIPPEHPDYGEIEGVLVVGVQPASRAALNGLQPEDVVLAVNRAPVTSVSELSQQLGEARSAIALTVLREGQRLFVVVR